MPIYEYQCSACGHHLEAFQKISDTPLTDCPKCHKSTLNKLISAAGFQLKGTGWYATDYSRKGKTKEAEAGGKADSGSDGKTDSKSDSKTDSKATESKTDTSSGNSSSHSGASS